MKARCPPVKSEIDLFRLKPNQTLNTLEEELSSWSEIEIIEGGLGRRRRASQSSDVCLNLGKLQTQRNIFTEEIVVSGCRPWHVEPCD